MHLMAGYMKSNYDTLTSSEVEHAGPYVATVNPVTQISTVIGPSSSYYSYFPGAYTERGYKADFDWWVGNNKISFGAQYYRDMQIDDFGGNINGIWTYYDEPGQILPNGSTVSSSDGNYVQQTVYNVDGVVKLHEKSMYLQDSLQVTPRWLLYGGLRWDSNTYTDGSGEPFATMPLFSPRLGFAWDVNGDSSFKVGGSIGRYSLALPLNFSAGVGISDVYYQNFYTYTGRTAQQVPTGLTQIGSSYVTANGQPIGPAQVGQVNLKAPYEYAANLYMQKKLHHAWSANAGIGVTDLKRVIDETCEEANITAFAQAHGFPNYNASTITNPCFEV
ncbi:tonb-dependent outer membrane receptor oar-like protein, partial [mine drainage metagenome]